MMTILAHIPTYVYGIFLALLAAGFAQSRPRQVSLALSVLLPVAMAGLALYGILGTFGLSTIALLAWANGVTLSALLVSRRMAHSVPAYDAASRSFAVPGSWVPLAAMMTLFVLKMVAAISLALHPALHQANWFVLPLSAAYGLSNGLFLGRALPLWKVAAGQRTSLPAAA